MDLDIIIRCDDKINNIKEEIERNWKEINETFKNRSIYAVQSSNRTWENLIRENMYFSSIEKPAQNIDDFIDNLNNVIVDSIDIAKKSYHMKRNVLV